MRDQRSQLTASNGAESLVLPAKHDRRFAGVFAWYTRRLLSQRFHAVRLCASSQAAARSLDADDRPVVLLLNHSSWWDPLIGFAVGTHLLASRVGIAPMDRDQLTRFAFFRRIGLFGIDPDDPKSLPAMVEYASSFVATSRRPTVALTPQGRFTDVREPIVLRPGAAALCAALGDVVPAVLSIEYAFWQDQRPEAFLRLGVVDPPSVRSTTSWHRVLTASMRESALKLSELVIARDPGAFVPLIQRRGARSNPVYDLILRLRGRSGEIAARRDREHADRAQRVDAGASGHRVEGSGA